MFPKRVSTLLTAKRYSSKMKRTYISPTVKVDMAEVADALLVTSIQISDESGNEEFVKEQATDGEWDIDW